MRNLLVIAAFILSLGLAGVAEAQAVRSSTYRPPRSHVTTHRSHVTTQRGHGGYYGHRYRGYGGVRLGVGVGWGHSYYSYSPYMYNSVPLMQAWAWKSYGPRFVHYPARCPAPCLPQPLPVVVQAPPVQTYAPPAETIKLRPGESIRNGNVVIANIDGKIVILQAEPANGQ